MCWTQSEKICGVYKKLLAMPDASDIKTDVKAIFILAAVIAIVVVLSHMVTVAMPQLPMPAAALLLTIPGINFLTLAVSIGMFAYRK